MVIERIALKNIRVYPETEIFLRPGVNFIKGRNGAGKSTLIECIGYALFNHYDSKSANEDLLTYGKAEGMIEIDFTGADGRKYTVVRTVAEKQNKRSWQVYERGSKTPLELFYENEKQLFLADAMGLEKETDVLFRDIIGVRQGAFREPFEKPTEERKKYFNRIFRVEDYNRAFEALSPVLRELAHREELTAKDVAFFSEKAAGLDEKTAELEKIRAGTAELMQRERQLKSALAEAEAALLALRRLREQKTQAEKQVLSGEEAMRSLQKQIEEKQKQEALALAAKERQAALVKVYESYMELRRRLETLDEKAAAKRELFIKAANAGAEAGKKTAQIETERKNLAQEQADLEEEKGELLRSRIQLQRDLEGYQSEAQAAGAKGAELQSLEKRLLSFENYVARGTAFVEKKLSPGILLVERQKQSLEALNAEETGMQALRTGEARYLEAKGRAEQLLQRKTALEEKQRTLAAYEGQLEDGVCPFFDGECFLAKRQGKDGVCAQKAETVNALQSIEKELATCAEEAESLKAYDGAGMRHTALLERIAKEESEQERLLSELSTLAAQPSSWNMDEMIGAMSREYLKATGEHAPDGTAEALFREYLKLQSPYEAAVRYKACFAAFAEWVTTVREKIHAHTLAQSRSAGQINEKMAAVTAELKGAETRIRALEDQERSLILTRDGLVQKQVERDRLQSEAAALQEAMKAYDGLEKETEELKKEAAAKEAGYLQYQQCKAEAEKLEGIQVEAAALQEALEQRKTALGAAREELSALENAYDADGEARLQGETANLHREKGEITGGLKHLKDEAARVAGEIEQKREAGEQLRALQKRIDIIREAQQIVKNTRAALKTAGPQIASIFRGRIETRADGIYRSVSREGVNLRWSESYEVELCDVWKGQERRRTFKQLSGGEKMTAALAVRLSLLEEFSAAGIGFFDEPTDNMDRGRRENLADTLSTLCAGFSQVFVISHDDTFDRMTDNVVVLNPGTAGTTVTS